MKTTILFILIGALALASNAAEPTSATLRRCPYGHNALRDVPLRYGYYPGPWPASFSKALARREFALGGCVQMLNSPKFEVVCTKCGFTHSITEIDSPETGHWSRDSEDPSSFKQPFSPLVTSFPKAPAKLRRGAAQYSQYLSNTLALEIQTMNYISREPIGKLCDRIVQWIERTGSKFSYEQRSALRTDGIPLEFFEWHGVVARAPVSVEVGTDYGNGLTSVTLRVFAPPSLPAEISGGDAPPDQPKIPGLVP